MVPIYKDNGDVLECNNYRGIKLKSHTMKLWERMIEITNTERDNQYLRIFFFDLDRARQLQNRYLH